MATQSKSFAAGILLVAFSAIFGAIAYQGISFWMSSPAGEGPGRTVFYEVKPHAKPQSLSEDLERLGIVTDARLFYWYSRLTGKSQKFKAGDYRFTTKMRPDEVLSVVMSGVSYGFPFTVPEGYTLVQISQLLENTKQGSQEAFLKLCSDKKLIAELGFGPMVQSLEGYLFPDTYLLERNTAVADLIRQMVRKFRSVFTADLLARASTLGFSEHQVVTLASIVEKETGAPEERPLIASIFHNRLKKKMKLQSDPTVVYGVKEYNGNITRADLDRVTPYNTYRIQGLPAGPIANPGKDALMAVLYPAESDYLYFVSHNDGTHEFTSTYEDHHKAVLKYQVDKKAREGKSWRDLKKNQANQKAQ